MKKLITLFFSIVTVLAQSAVGGWDVTEFKKNESLPTSWIVLSDRRMPYIDIGKNENMFPVYIKLNNSGNLADTISVRLKESNLMELNRENIRILDNHPIPKVNNLFKIEIELKHRYSCIVKVDIFHRYGDDRSNPIGTFSFFLNVKEVEFPNNYISSVGIVPGEKGNIKIDGLSNGKNIESVVFMDSDDKTPEDTELHFELQTDENSIVLKDFVINNTNLLSRGFNLWYTPKYFHGVEGEKPVFKHENTFLKLENIIKIFPNNLNVKWIRKDRDKSEKIETAEFYPGISTQTFVAQVTFNTNGVILGGQPECIITPINKSVKFKKIVCPTCQNTPKLQTYEYQLEIEPTAEAKDYQITFKDRYDLGITRFQIMQKAIPISNRDEDFVHLRINGYEEQALELKLFDGATKEVHHEDEFKEFELEFQNKSENGPQHYLLEMSIIDEANNSIELLPKEIFIGEGKSTTTIEIENKVGVDAYVEEWNRFKVNLSPIVSEYQLNKKDLESIDDFKFEKEIFFTGSTFFWESRKWIPFFNIFGYSSFVSSQIPYNSLFNLGIGVASYGVDKRNKVSKWGIGGSVNVSNPDNAFSKDSLRKTWGFSFNLIARYTGIEEFPLTLGFGPGWAYLRENENSNDEQPRYRLKFGLNYGIYVNTSLSAIF